MNGPHVFWPLSPRPHSYWRRCMCRALLDIVVATELNLLRKNVLQVSRVPMDTRAWEGRLKKDVFWCIIQVFIGGRFLSSFLPGPCWHGKLGDIGDVTTRNVIKFHEQITEDGVVRVYRLRCLTILLLLKRVRGNHFTKINDRWRSSSDDQNIILS